jgi:CSLREA domain-containing protein
VKISHRRLTQIVILFAVLACGATPCTALDIYVTITGDTNDGICGGPLHFPCSLRDAILVSNARPGEDTIHLPAGTYNLTLLGENETFAETGDLDIWDTVTIYGSGAGTTIIDGQEDDRVFEGHSGAFAHLYDLTIRYGEAGDFSGGGFHNYGIDLVLFRRCTIEHNRATRGGGISSTNGTINILESTVRSNSADCAGAISSLTNSWLTINKSTVSVNFTLLDSPATGCWMESVEAGGAGANITNSTIWGNLGPHQSGTSGITVKQSAVVFIEHSTVSNNYGYDVRNATGQPNAVRFENSIISGTCAGTGFATNGGNVSDDDGNSCGLVNPGDYFGPPIYLLPLGDYGGHTATTPLENHPQNLAIDNVWADPGCFSIDQRDEDRPQDGNGDGAAHCDSGAVEVAYEPSDLPFSDGFESGDTSSWSETVP